MQPDSAQTFPSPEYYDLQGCSVHLQLLSRNRPRGFGVFHIDGNGVYQASE